MNKLGLASVAVMALTSVAAAGQYDPSNAIAGGDARSMGTFTGAQFDAIRHRTTSVETSSIYSTNWTSDSNGAAYTVGNLTPWTSAGNGTEPGQGGWIMYSTATTTTAASNTKINGGRPAGSSGTGQAMQITGGSTASGSRYIYQDLSAGWAARNAGENTFWTEYESYFSATQTSTNADGLITYDTTGSAILTGIYTQVGTATSAGTTGKRGTIYGFSNYLNGTSVGNYIFNLTGTTVGSQLFANAGGWTKYASNFNQNDGVVEWYVSVDGGANYTGFYVNGAAAGKDVQEIDFYSSSQRVGTNTSAGSMIFGSTMAYATPAPGAVALVGLAGLMARRRKA